MNRRSLLRSSGALIAGATAGVVSAGAVIDAAPANGAAADPLLTLITEYRAALDAYHSADAEDDAADEVARAPMMALWRRLVNDCPAPTTMEGAIEGVRLVEEDLRSNGFGSFHDSVLAVAVAYFERRV